VFAPREEYGVRVLLVGAAPGMIRGALASFGKPSLPIEIIPATEVITMEDHPAQAFRRQEGQFGARGGAPGERRQSGRHGLALGTPAR